MTGAGARCGLQAQIQALVAAVTALCERLGILEQATAAGPRLPAPEPQRFSGYGKHCTSRVHEWVHDLTSYLKYYGIADSQEGPALASCYLVGSARAWWHLQCEECAEGEQPFATWADLRSAITKQFSSPTDGEDAFDQLQSVEQHGTVRGYTTCFRRLVLRVKRAEASLLSEPCIVYFYVRGLRPDISVSVDLKSPGSLEEAVALALRWE